MLSANRVNLSTIELIFLIGTTNPQLDLLTKSPAPVFSVTITGHPAAATSNIV